MMRAHSFAVGRPARTSRRHGVLDRDADMQRDQRQQREGRIGVDAQQDLVIARALPPIGGSTMPNATSRAPKSEMPAQPSSGTTITTA